MAIEYSKHYNYAYFCGANITISLNSQWVEDAVGITYSVMNSQTPVYGYCSMLFDAVAPGQKLVQGSFVVNFRSPNYIYSCIHGGRARQVNLARDTMAFKQKAAEIMGDKKELNDKDVEELKALFTQSAAQLEAGGLDQVVAQAKNQLTEKYYGGIGNPQGVTTIDPMHKDVTLQGPFDIRIAYSGIDDRAIDFQQTIYSAYIIGHGSVIQIDENVILEEYNFFARDLVNG